MCICLHHIDATCARSCQDSTFDIAWKAFAKLQMMHHFLFFYFFFFKKDSNNRSLAVQMKREPRLLPFPALIMASFIVFIFLSKWAMKERWRHRFCHFTAPCCLIGRKPCVWARIRCIYSLISGRVALFSSCFPKQGSPSPIKRTSFSLCAIH